LSVVRVYRVCRAVYARLDGLGAKLVGGRWNSPGNPVVYMAESVALAVLENLVHMSRQDYPTGYVKVTAIVPDEVRIINEADLRAEGGLNKVSEQELGDAWVHSGRSPVLRVPSAVVSGDFNYLLNPGHPDFSRIEVLAPTPFRFDERLFDTHGE
jgi:RES domain-containing protein